MTLVLAISFNAVRWDAVMPGLRREIATVRASVPETCAINAFWLPRRVLQVYSRMMFAFFFCGMGTHHPSSARRWQNFHWLSADWLCGTWELVTRGWYLRPNDLGRIPQRLCFCTSWFCRDRSHGQFSHGTFRYNLQFIMDFSFVFDNSTFYNGNRLGEGRSLFIYSCNGFI